MNGVREYYETAVKYIFEKFPLHDETLAHAKFLNFEKRESAE